MARKNRTKLLDFLSALSNSTREAIWANDKAFAAESIYDTRIRLEMETQKTRSTA